MRATLALAALVGTGCSAVLSFNECSMDSDCAARVPHGTTYPYMPSDMYCTSDHYCVLGVPEERICSFAGGVTLDSNPTVIGGLFRLTGASDSKDTSMANAAILGAGEIMGLQQRPIAVVVCDTSGPPQLDGTTQAQRAIRRVVETYHAVAVIGPTTSTDVSNTFQYAVQKNVLMISPSATSPAIKDLMKAGLVWRTAANDLLQAKVLATRVQTLLVPSSSPLNTAYSDSQYGRLLNQSFIAAWGGTPRQTIQFPDGMANVASIENALAVDNPVVSLLIADADSTALVSGLSTSRAGLATTKFLMTDAAKGLALLNNPDPNVLSRISGTGPGILLSNPVFTTFRLAFMGKYQQDPASTAFVANTYDAFYVAAMAVAAVPSSHPGGNELSAMVAKMSTRGNTVNVGPLEFVKGVSALKMGGAIDLAGTSGPLDFDNASGDVLTAPIEVWAIDTTTNPTMPRYYTLTVTIP